MPGWWSSRSRQNRPARTCGQVAQGGVVDRGLAFAQVVHEQVADRPAGDAVAVDQLLAVSCPGVLNARTVAGPPAGRPRRRAAAGRSTGCALPPPRDASASSVQQFHAVADGDVADRGRPWRPGSPRSGATPGAWCACWTRRARQIAASAANPAGSRARAISAARLCRGRRRQQPTQARADARPRRSAAARHGAGDVQPDVLGVRWLRQPVLRLPCIGSRRQAGLPAASAPLASHRSCQVSPGWRSSQSSIRVRPRRRVCRPVAGLRVNGRREQPGHQLCARWRSPASSGAPRGAGTAAAAPAGDGPGLSPARSRS